MKNITLFSLIFAIILASCTKNNQNQSTKISGQINNPKEGNASFELQDSTLTARLDSNGNFSIALPIDTVQTLTFRLGEEIAKLYVRPGDNLSLTIDPNQFDETLKYEGQGAAINNFLISTVLMDDSLKNIVELSSLPEDSFLLAFQHNFSAKEKALKSSEVKDQVFIDWYLNSNKWEMLHGLLLYPSFRSSVIEEEFNPSKNYYSFQDSLDLYDSKNLAYDYYLDYVERGITNKVLERFKDKGPQDISNYIMASVEEITEIPSDPIKEKLLYLVCKRHLVRLKDQDRSLLLTEWKALNPSTEHISEIDKKLKFLNNLAKGKPAPDFAYLNLEGDSVSLKDFRGQVVYIDVWATWCGPCIKEQPDMEKLQEKYKNENVAFIAISIDESTEPWRKMVNAKELGGHHLYAPGEFEASIMKQYAIKGIPRFILIDQEGKIVDSNAARPSGDIASEISELLNSNKEVI